MNEQVIINLRVQSEQAIAALNKTKKAMKGLSGLDLDVQMQKVAAANQALYTSQKRLNETLKGKPFQGWAMSLMFAGMALQRMSQTIYKFGTKAFQEISHSVEGTVTNTDMLEGSMKYLGFTIGQALEPMIAFLIPIVDNISQWVETHPALTRWGVALLAIVGTLAMVGGALRLAIANGLVPFLAIIGIKVPTAAAMFTALKTEIIATGVALKAMSIGGLASLLGIIGGIIILIGYIVKLKDAVGGWGEFFKSVARGILRVNAIILESFIWIGAQIGKVWATIFNGIIAILNKIISASNSLLGTDFKKIEKMQVDYSWGDGVLRNYLDWEQSGSLAPDKGYATGGGMTPTYNTYINIDRINTTETYEELLGQTNRFSNEQFRR